MTVHFNRKASMVTSCLFNWVSMVLHSAFRLFCWWCGVVWAFPPSTSRKLGQFCRYSTNQCSFNHASCFCPGVTFYWNCIFVCFVLRITAVIVFIFCCHRFYKCKFTLLKKSELCSVVSLQVCYPRNVPLCFSWFHFCFPSKVFEDFYIWEYICLAFLAHFS